MIAITVLGGVAEPVGRFIGQKLGATVEPVMYPNPEAYLQSFGKSEWDIAIGPRVLAPADKADSTTDLWVISLIYVAAPGKEFPNIASVDKAGVRIGVKSQRTPTPFTRPRTTPLMEPRPAARSPT